MSTATKRLTFKRWLARQRKRDDPVGDLARDVFQDCRRWTSARTLKGVLSHLSSLGACRGAMKAAERAWVEFENQTGRNCIMSKPKQPEQAPDPQALFIEYLEARQLGQEAQAERLLEQLKSSVAGP